METSFAEQVKELRRDAMGGAALQKTAEQLTEQLAAAEAEVRASPSPSPSPSPHPNQGRPRCLARGTRRARRLLIITRRTWLIITPRTRRARTRPGTSARWGVVVSHR